MDEIKEVKELSEEDIGKLREVLIEAKNGMNKIYLTKKRFKDKILVGCVSEVFSDKFFLKSRKDKYLVNFNDVHAIDIKNEKYDENEVRKV